MIKNNAGFNVDVCKSGKTNVDQNGTDSNRLFKSSHCSNLNKLVFVHLNNYSIRIKFERTPFSTS